MKKDRNSNIELLRIISIIMIVISHYCVHSVGGQHLVNVPIGLNRFLLEFLTLGNLGSILFIIISGYYLNNSNCVKIKKLLKIVFQVLFYSIVIYSVLLIFHVESFKITNFIKSIFPITFKMYWFATAYIIIYIFHPFINKFINNTTKKEHLLFILLMFIIFSVLATFTYNDYYGNELVQFLLFYSIGAYLNKYPNNYFNKKNNNTKIMILSIMLIVLSIITLDILGCYKTVFGSHSRYFLSRTSPLAIIFCVCLFNAFNKKSTYYNSIINTIS